MFLILLRQKKQAESDSEEELFEPMMNSKENQDIRSSLKEMKRVESGNEKEI